MKMTSQFLDETNASVGGTNGIAYDDEVIYANIILSICSNFISILFLFGSLWWNNTFKSSPTSSFYLKYSGHEFRWIATFLLLLLHLAMVLESFLADPEIPFSAFRLSLHISDVTPVALDVVTLFVATQMEKLHLPSLSSALAVTWLVPGVVQVARVCYVVIRVDMFYTFVRFYGYIITLVLYVGLFVNDVRIYFLKVYKNPLDKYDRQRFQKQLEKEGVKFVDSYSIFPIRMSFWWVWPLLRQTKKAPLSKEDIGSIPQRERGVFIHLEMRNNLRRLQQRKNQYGSKIWYVLLMKSGGALLHSAVLTMLAGVMSVVPPIALKRIITIYGNHSHESSVQELTHVKGNYFTSVEDYFGNGFVLVMVMTIAQLLVQICESWSMHINLIEGCRLAAGIQGLICEKMLYLSRSNLNIGKITNHMTADLQRLRFLALAVHAMWSVPLKIVIAVVLLYGELGVACFPGILLVFFSILYQFEFAKKAARFEKEKLRVSDSRVKRIGEMLSGMRYLKMSGYEDFFSESISKIRGNECHHLGLVQLWNFILSAVGEATPYAVCIIMFFFSNWYNETLLTPAKAFFTITVLKSLQEPLTSFSREMGTLYSCIISFHRIEKYFDLPTRKHHGYLKCDVIVQQSDVKTQLQMEKVGNLLIPEVERSLIGCYGSSMGEESGLAIKVHN
ncbi:ATP-binding cassette sub-family C member 8-like isoform X1 [Apostichopus japonicus]|uniref:ATP-binding cassette sub-family C member 8-like isoform X1 n=1 Tax=Stichopus japonicus TaxID=307972 RepID=UPI003AB50FBB